MVKSAVAIIGPSGRSALLIIACGVGVALFSLQLPLLLAESPIAVTLFTERYVYTGGEAVTIAGKVLNSSETTENGLPRGLMMKVEIEISQADTGDVIYQASTASRSDGFFSDSGFRAPSQGDFLVTVTVSDADGQGTVRARTTVRSVPAFSLDLLKEPSLAGILLSPIAFLLLLSLSVWPVEGAGAEELAKEEATGVRARFRRWLKRNTEVTPMGLVVLQFLFLTVLTVSPILSFLFFPRQIGADAPLGLVTERRMVNGEPLTSWVLNIGGTFNGAGYAGGLSIPLYVIILGLLGAYLAYLYKIPAQMKGGSEAYEQARKVETEVKEKWRKAFDRIIADQKPREQKSGERDSGPMYKALDTLRALLSEELSAAHDKFRDELVRSSLATLAYFLLGPVLAVAVWLILRQAGTAADPPYTLAIASVTVGLLTEQVTKRLVEEAGRILGGQSEKPPTRMTPPTSGESTVTKSGAV